MVPNRRPQIKNLIFNPSLAPWYACLGHFNGSYERYTEQYINCRHRVYWYINCVLLFQLFTIILLLACTCNFSWDFQKKLLYKHVHCLESAMCLELKLVHFVLAQFQSKNALIQLLCFGIEYWRSHRPFLSRKLQW